MHIGILRRAAVLVILFALLVSSSISRAAAQSIDIDRVVAELEPEIERTLIEGKIPSATIALVAGDRVIWTKGYGQANIWARFSMNSAICSNPTITSM